MLHWSKLVKFRPKEMAIIPSSNRRHIKANSPNAIWLNAPPLLHDRKSLSKI